MSRLASLSSLFLGQFFGRWPRRRSRFEATSAPVVARLATELEARTLLSGTTKVTFASGTLTLTSVDDTTQAGVLNGKSDNEITITGGAVGVITLSGFGEVYTGAGTSFTGVTKINVVANDGNDVITLTDVNITGAVSIQGGDGDNTVQGTGGAFASLSVTNGDGEDLLSYSSVTIAGAVSISNGEGDTGSTFTNVAFGSLKMTNLDGSDDQHFAGVNTINGTTQIDNGLGSSNTQFDDTGNTLNGALTITNGEGHEHVVNLALVTARAITVKNAGGSNRVSLLSGIITGSVSVTNGDGEDEFEMSGLTPVSITGNLSINNKSGDSLTELRGVITGNVSVTALAGQDFVNAPNALTVTGSTTINLGNGEGHVDFRSSGILNFGGTLSVTMADGDDEFRIDSPNLATLKAVTVNYGTGDSTTQLNGTINGNLSITSKSGDDEVIAHSQLAVTGTTTLDLGNGDSDIDFRSNSTINFGGNLTIKSGDGNDQFRIDSPSSYNLKGVSINWGTGDSQTEFGGTTIVMDALSITGGAGDHNVEFGGTSLSTKNVTLNFKGRRTGAKIEGNASTMTVNGNLSVTIGGGLASNGGVEFEETLNVTGTTNITLGQGDEEVQLVGGGTLTGNVTVTGNGGSDAIILEGMTIAGNLSLNSGTGNDVLKIDDSTIRGTTNLTLGAGADRVEIEQEDTDVNSRFEKAVTISGGAGADDFLIGRASDANDFAQFLLSFSLNGGTGLDNALFLNAGQGGTRSNLFGAVPSVSLIEVQL